MNARERVLAAINHREPDRVPIDLGAAHNTGISVCALNRLRAYYGLPERDIPIYETMQMLGTVDEDIRSLIGCDVIGLRNWSDFLGVPFDGPQQVFEMPDGTRALISARQKVRRDADGSIRMYPLGDDTVSPSIIMPEGGYFFDNIDRAPDFDEDDLTPADDFAEDFPVMSDEEARYYETESHRLATETDYAVLGVFGRGSLGDPSILPGAAIRNPKGIRRYDDWMMAHLLYPEYVEAVFDLQTERAIQNLEIYHQAAGDRIQICVISGTDFGNQNGPMIRPDIFRALYKPYYKRMNDWVHRHTSWKTFYHSCGSVAPFLDDFVEMGVDILNPVQLSAAGMDGPSLKAQYGDRLVFWGGGVNTQETLPNGTPEQIEAEVRERIGHFKTGGGYVFATIHNIVGDVRAENIDAVFRAARACR